MYILLALLIFSVLIFIHELGHFIVARLCGVQILEFAIGMGPKILSHKSKKSGIRYSLRLFPIGGFVSMLGEDGMEAVQGSSEESKNSDLLINEEPKEKKSEETKPTEDDELNKHAYCNQSVWKRILISLAGPVMNVLLGFVLMLVMVLISGHGAAGTTEVHGFYVQYMAEESYAGLEKGDLILGVKKDSEGDDAFRSVLTYNGFQKFVKENEEDAYSLIIRRSGAEEDIRFDHVVLNETLFTTHFQGSLSEQSGLKPNDEVIKVNNTSVHTANELGYEIMNQGHKPIRFTVIRQGQEVVLENVVVPSFVDSGATFGEMDFFVKQEADFGFLTVLKHTWFRSVSTVKMVFDSLFGLFSGRYGVEAVSGPVGITKTISEAAKTGMLNVLYLVTVISINLGVMNLLPIPALDGGHLLLYFIEAIRRKPVKREVEGIINFVGLVIMLSLMVFISIKDIISL